MMDNINVNCWPVAATLCVCVCACVELALAHMHITIIYFARDLGRAWRVDCFFVSARDKPLNILPCFYGTYGRAVAAAAAANV